MKKKLGFILIGILLTSSSSFSAVTVDPNITGIGGGIQEGADVTFGNMTATKIVTTLSGSSSNFNLSSAAGILSLKGTSIAAVNSSGAWGYILNATDFTLYGSRKLGFAIGNSAPDVKLIRDSAGILKITDGDSALGDLILGNIIVNSVTFPNMTTIFGDYSAINNMNQILCDATAGDVDIHIVSASDTKGRIGNVKKIDSSGNSCIIEPAGAETIDGVANKSISTQWGNLTYFSDNSNLLIR